MNIITDILIIEDLANKGQEENWRFRAYLKGPDISGARVDSAVHMLARWISKQIDCGKCANCCKACSPILQMPDIQRMAKHFNMEPASFQQKYLVNEEEENGYYFRKMPCPFCRRTGVPSIGSVLMTVDHTHIFKKPILFSGFRRQYQIAQCAR